MVPTYSLLRTPRYAPARWCACARSTGAASRPVPRAGSDRRPPGSAPLTTCQRAPLRPVLARPSMTPRNRSRTSASTPQLPQPVVGHRQQCIQHQFRAGTSPSSGQYSRASMPLRAASRKFACAAVKLILFHSGLSAVGQAAQHAVVEGRIRQHVDDGRPGRQHPVLQAQMRAPVEDVVDRPVPAVHGAVVQA